MLTHLTALSIFFGLAVTQGVELPPPVIPVLTTPAAVTTLQDLRRSGKLRLAVRRGTLAYFLRRGVPSGYEFELLSRFADGIGVDLRVRVVESAEEAARTLENAGADVTVLPPRRSRVKGGARAAAHAVGRDGKRHPVAGILWLRSDAPELLVALNEFLRAEATTSRGAQRVAQYLRRPERFRLEEQQRRPKISPYDHLIAKHAANSAFDWRMIASLIYEESGFDPAAVSHKGARGLMQLMPFVLPEVGVEDPHEPESAIRGGVRHLERITRYFPDVVGDDLLAMTLAGYLMGPAHVLDAQHLAEETGRDPRRWEGGVKVTLPLLEEREHYGKARFGYAPGRHGVRYVERIFNRYHHYRQHVGMAPGLAASIEATDYR